jgi:hypothetical protein
MIAEKPTDAVLDNITVPFGKILADEFFNPSSLTFSEVSKTSVASPLLICQTSDRENQGTVQFSQYSGLFLLGVWPDSSLAKYLIFPTFQ